MHGPLRAHTRLGSVLLLVAMILTTGTACSVGEDATDSTALGKIEVGGDFGAVPQVSFETPLSVTETATRTVIEGGGRSLEDGDVALISYVAISARTGETLEDNFDTQPQTMRVSEEDAGPLYSELVGKKEGTRLLRVELGTADHPDPVVLVYDLMHTRAWGEPVEPPDDAPAVQISKSGEPRITIPDHDPPNDLQIVPLRRGDGAQVAAGMAVTVRYTAVSWASGEVVDNTWAPGKAPVTIAFTGLIEGWQNGLVDVRVGSQVMLVVPPEQAFGEDTLVYVIDVLAVSPLTGTEGSGS